MLDTNNLEFSLDETYEQLIQIRDGLNVKIKDKIQFDLLLIEREEQGVIYPNAINVIQGKAGCHKSRLVEHFLALLMSEGGASNKLGYIRPYYAYDHFYLLYVDTERNIKDQFPYALKQILKQAGHSSKNKPEHFDFLSLISVNRDKRLSILKFYINNLRKVIKSPIVIVLDVLTDCLGNFNDPRESLQLIDYMNWLINYYDITFIAVIHENPGSGEKARGHVGTELLNKASTQIQIGFERFKNSDINSILKVNYVKTRLGRKPRPFYVEYNEVIHGLQLVNETLLENLKPGVNLKADENDVCLALTEIINGSISR